MSERGRGEGEIESFRKLVGYLTTWKVSKKRQVKIKIALSIMREGVIETESERV